MSLTEKVGRGTPFYVWFYGQDGSAPLDIQIVREWLDRAMKYVGLQPHRSQREAMYRGTEDDGKGAGGADDCEEDDEGQDDEEEEWDFDDEGNVVSGEEMRRINDQRLAKGGLRRGKGGGRGRTGGRGRGSSHGCS